MKKSGGIKLVIVGIGAMVLYANFGAPGLVVGAALVLISGF